MTGILSIAMLNDNCQKSLHSVVLLKKQGLTLWAHDSWATLVIPLFNHTIFSNGFDKWADSEVAHQHLVMAGAI